MCDNGVMSTARITRTTRDTSFGTGSRRYLAVIPAEMVEGLPTGYSIRWEVYGSEAWCDDTDRNWIEWRDMLILTDASGADVAWEDGPGFAARYTRKADLIRGLGFVRKVSVGPDSISYVY